MGHVAIGFGRLSLSIVDTDGTQHPFHLLKYRMPLTHIRLRVEGTV